MKNVGGLLLSSWFQLLNGALSVGVYRVDADPEVDNYVQLRLESDTEDDNNHSFVTLPVIVTEVVTRFNVRIDDEIAMNLDTEIGRLLKSRPGTHNLPPRDGIQVVEVRRSNATYINEDDGAHRYYRIVRRHVHRVVQLVNES